VITTINQDKPDAVLIAIGGNPAIAFMRAAANASVTSKIVAYSGVLVGSYLKPGAGATNGVISADTYETFFKNAANSAFLKQFDSYSGAIAECKGLVPDKQSALTYSQVLLVTQAAKKANSADPATLRKTIIAGTWNLPSGSTTFQLNGQANQKYANIIGKDVDGKPALVEYTG
jgi:ABC-type branched-subunit amino acid transport system substrate-binding protein